jgi:hypothetical protein
MIATMSIEHFDAATPPVLMNVRGCYDGDDEDHLEDLNDDEDDDTNIDDSTSVRTATTATFHSTTRRLTNAKVREIFEYLYHPNVEMSSSPPKIPIPFTIVPVNSNGKALSPPSYEFECK